MRRNILMIEGQYIVEQFKKKINKLPDDPQKVWDIIEFSNVYADSFGELVIPLLDLGIEISHRIGHTSGEVICNYNKEFVQLNSGSKGSGNTYYHQQYVDKLLEKIKDDTNAYCYALNFKAYNHWYKGEYEKGFDVVFSTLKISGTEPSVRLGWLQYALGVFYYDTKDLENAEQYYTAALTTFRSIDYAYGIARSMTGIGSVAIQKKELKRAFDYLTEASEIFRGLSHSAGLSRALNDLGTLEFQNKNYPAALKLLFDSAGLREKVNHRQGLITTYTAIGEVYLAQNEKKHATDFFKKALELSIMIDAKQKSGKLHRLLANLYKETGDVTSAYEHLERFHEINASLLGDESANNIKKIQTKFETEKAEQVAEVERLKNSELKKAYEIIESKNKDIHDSINYAKRIQSGILPSDADLKQWLNDLFVLYLPKDIVSGDFYWAVKGTSQRTGDTVSIIAAIDCTGHGVPGAFMSMLGNALLNQTKFDPEIIYPADVLNYLNRELPKNLRSQEQNSDIKDGMDMALCSFDFEKMKLIYAGANNPCWIIRNGSLYEIKADKHPISASLTDKPSFTNKEFALEKGDMVYLFTDGFADQFGGPRGKKFKYKQLAEKLTEVSVLSTDDQKTKLTETITKWKGELEQVDDILIIGVKI